MNPDLNYYTEPCHCGECHTRTHCCTLCGNWVFTCHFMQFKHIDNAFARFAIKYYEKTGCCTVCAFDYEHWSEVAADLRHEIEQ